MDLEIVYRQMDEFLAANQYDRIILLLIQYGELTKNTNKLAIIYYMCVIYLKEKEAGVETILSKIGTVEELVTRYRRLKFLLYRLDYGVSDDGVESLYRFLVEQRVSAYELTAMVDYCAVHKDEVWRAIRKVL